LVAQQLNATRKTARESISLGRNFLHAAELEFAHPTSGKLMHFTAPLPVELDNFLTALRNPSPETSSAASK
jgi:23S rRNA pseudouridine1911/1915/1917 synthase